MDSLPISIRCMPDNRSALLAHIRSEQESPMASLRLLLSAPIATKLRVARAEMQKMPYLRTFFSNPGRLGALTEVCG